MDTRSLHGENRRESDNVYMVGKYDTCGESILRVINCIKGETWCKCSASLCLCPAANAPCPSWRGSQWWVMWLLGILMILDRDHPCPKLLIMLRGIDHLSLICRIWWWWLTIIADEDDNDNDQPEPINVGVRLALVLVSKGVQGGDIHTRHLLSDFFSSSFLFVTNTNKYNPEFVVDRHQWIWLWWAGSPVPGREWSVEKGNATKCDFAMWLCKSSEDTFENTQWRKGWCTCPWARVICGKGKDTSSSLQPAGTGSVVWGWIIW